MDPEDVFLYWLAVENVRHAIENGQRDKMFRLQKKLRYKIGWPFRERSQRQMAADIAHLAGSAAEAEDWQTGVDW